MPDGARVDAPIVFSGFSNKQASDEGASSEQLGSDIPQETPSVPPAGPQAPSMGITPRTAPASLPSVPLSPSMQILPSEPKEEEETQSFLVRFMLPDVGVIEETYELYEPFEIDSSYLQFDELSQCKLFLLGHKLGITRTRGFVAQVGKQMNMVVGADCGNPVNYENVRRMPYVRTSELLGFELELFFQGAASDNDDEDQVQ